MTTSLTFQTNRLASRFRVVWTLLLLAALPGCMGDGLSDYQRKQNKKEDCANALRAQGAMIEEKNYPRYGYGYGYAINLSGIQIADDTFKNLKCLDRVAELDLSKSSITDEQMDQLVELRRFVRLDLSNTAVTDAGLEKLANIPALLNLKLVGTRVTPSGVERFKKQRLAKKQQRLANAKNKSKFKETNVQLK